MSSGVGNGSLAPDLKRKMTLGKVGAENSNYNVQKPFIEFKDMWQNYSSNKLITMSFDPNDPTGCSLTLFNTQPAFQQSPNSQTLNINVKKLGFPHPPSNMINEGEEDEDSGERIELFCFSDDEQLLAIATSDNQIAVCSLDGGIENLFKDGVLSDKMIEEFS